MSTNTPPLTVRGTVAVCRELDIPAWFLERVLREEAITIQRIGNCRAWTDEDVGRLRCALADREARKAARSRKPSPVAPHVPLLDPVDMAQDLAAELDHEEESQS